MTDHTPPHSGSRWEPDADGTRPIPAPDHSAPDHSAADQPATDRAVAVSEPAAPQGRRRVWAGRRRAPLAAAAAVGLVAAAGTGGFAIGHEVAQGHPGGTDLTGDTRDGQAPGSVPGDGRQLGDRGGDGSGAPGFGQGRSGLGENLPGGATGDGTGRQTTYRVPAPGATGSAA